MFNVLIAILTIQLVIFVHELGHFLVAKKAGVDVYEFSVGFGPKIFQFKKNETTYTLRAIPLLGHVLFDDTEELNEDSNEENKAITLKENSLKSKGYLPELAVYLAGPAFNFLTAFIVLCGIYVFSGFPSTTIGQVINDSPAQIAGIEMGDTILEIDNIKINDWSDISYTINKLKKDEISIKIEKEDNSIKEILVNPNYNKESNYYSIGISPLFKKDIIKSISYGFISTIENIKINVKTISQLFLGWIPGIGDDSQKVELSGPIGTIQTISEESKKSMDSLVSMFVALNINIGVINLIPFVPVLDGGQAFIRTLEAIRRKSFSEDTIIKLKVGGALVLIGLMIFTTLKDIFNLF